MVQTPVLAASAMTSPVRAKPMQTISQTNWTQLPGAASEVVASPDGSLWVLSNEPSGTDKYIWHYVDGSWTNITGEAAQLAVSPSGALYALNSSGGIYSWSGSSWTALAGGASSLTVAADSSLYVISNGGSGAIWHYTSGTWTQLPGAGATLEASWDPNSYSTPGGTVSKGGFYVLNSSGYIYYGNSNGSYVAFTGQATAIAPTIDGGFFVLSYPANESTGTPIWYYNLSSPGWTEEGGAALDISANDAQFYVLSSSGAIYESSISGSGRAAGSGTALSGPLYPSDGLTDDGYGPVDVAENWNFPVQDGYDGTGETIALVMDSATSCCGSGTDVGEYLSYFEIPSTSRTITTESVDDASGTTGDQGAATVDEEMIAGLAPGANIILYQIPSFTPQYLSDAYEQILSDGEATVVDTPDAICEPSSSTMSSLDTVIAGGAQSGVAFVALSGLSGDACYDYLSGEYVLGASYPASDPNVIGVGGTENYPSSGTDEVTSQQVWNDDECGIGQCASGGGVSGYWPTPAFQNGLYDAASSTYRNVPDVAMPGDWVAGYVEGSWGPWLAVNDEEFAALMAEVYEYCGTSIENPITVPYFVYQTSGYTSANSGAAFVAVTSGNNQYGSNTPYYSAPSPSGYNDATGIGVPLGGQFAEQTCPSNQPAAGLQRPFITKSSTAAQGEAAPLSLNVTPRLAGLADEGERDAAAQTRIQIVLRPTATVTSDEQRVVKTLQSAGFTIVKTFRNALVVDAQASSATVESFFATRIDDVSEGRYGVRYMPVSPAIVPASLAPYVAGLSLDNVALGQVSGVRGR